MTSLPSINHTSVVLLLALVMSTTCDDFKSMKWRAGDVIACNLSGFLGLLGAKHWMLASDEDHIINVVKQSSTRGVIWEQTREQSGGFREDSCTNFGRSYDKSREEAVESARNFVNTQHYYDISGCNCQHWVNKWTKNAGGYSTSSAWWAMPYCPAY